ncbi:MAG: glycosyltransferase [Bacteroidetes bacterium]|nr:glycosyltransferase [Bacteroidota bacterium]
MSRKVINLITPHFAPENTAASHRMETAARILSASFDVNVFTLTERGKKFRAEKELWNDNLTVHYTYLPAYPKAFFPIRAFIEWWYSRKLVKKANRSEADMVLVTVPFMFLLNTVASKSVAAKKVADIRDLVWHYLPERNFIQRFFKKAVTKLMHRSLLKYDAITVTSEVEKKWLKKVAGIDGHMIHVVSNGIADDKFRVLQTLTPNQLKNEYVISYIGNIGSSQTLMPLVEAVKNVKGIRLNLIGDGNERRRIQDYLHKEDVRNVFLPGKLKWARTIPYYQSSSLLFAGLKNEFDTAIPSKLYEYLATGLPIFYIGTGAAANFMKTFENTFVIEYTDPVSIKKELLRIMHAAPELSADNARKVNDYYLRDSLSKRFVEISAGLLKEKELSNLFVEDLLSV